MPIKTINILKKEFENSLIQLIQESGIPACILVDILEKYNRQLQDIADADYERDLKSLQESAENKEDIESSEENPS